LPQLFWKPALNESTKAGAVPSPIPIKLRDGRAKNGIAGSAFPTLRSQETEAETDPCRRLAARR